MKEILIDYLPLVIDNSNLQESKESGLPLIIEGTIQRANAVNKNNRIYPKPILEKAVSKYVENFVSQHNAVGELDHPKHSEVALKNGCINILEMWWDGDDLKAKIQVLTTPHGNTVRAYINDGVKIGISSRANGSTKTIKESSGKYVSEVQADLEFSAWDIVSNPSTHGAFVGLTEGTEIPDEYKHECEIDDKINIIFDLLK